MTTSAQSILIGALVLALQTPTPTPTVTPKPPAAPFPPQGTPAATQTPAAAPRPGALVLTVMNEKGEVLGGASVAVHGAVDRAGSTGPDGVLTLQNMPVGVYRARISRDGFITFEKEVTVKSAARSPAEAVLSAAPPAPPPPSPSPTPAPETRPMTAMGTPGAPRTASIPDLAEQMLKDQAPMVERALGCSGLVQSTLILARESVALHRHADVDEVLYLVAGEATLTIGDKDQNISAGWYGLVPRDAAHALARRGRTPMVFLLVQSGKPCAK